MIRTIPYVYHFDCIIRRSITVKEWHIQQQPNFRQCIRQRPLP